jgi:hypothetical protein
MLFCCFWCLRTDMLHLIWFWFLRTDTPIYINNYFIFNELVTLSCRINFTELRLILITISYHLDLMLFAICYLIFEATLELNCIFYLLELFCSIMCGSILSCVVLFCHLELVTLSCVVLFCHLELVLEQ